ncbi:MAG: P44/Msp2 family outer membrane protein [Pseudomonadota bacterium]
MRRDITSLGTTLLMTVAAVQAAHAQQDTDDRYYTSFSAGLSLLGDSTNDGTFNGAFTTGAGTTIPAGTELPDGTAVGWDTEFSTGFALNGAFGRYFGPLRGEIELAYQANNVDTHTGVFAADIDLSDEDAGVLVTGADNLGVSVADLVADGQGDLSTVFIMANGYYDFKNDSAFTPYVGLGIGLGFVDVDYSPSDTTIIQDSATKFAYQLMAGATYDLNQSTGLYLGYRFRGTSSVGVEADLFSADFEIENTASILEAGVRFAF